MKVQLVAVAMAAAAVIAPAAPAAAQSLEGAHAFLQQVTTRGSTRGSWFPHGNQPGEYVTSWSGSGCRSSLGLADGSVIAIDWSKVSVVTTSGDGDSLSIKAGDFPTWSGGVNALWLKMESREIVQRAVKAGDYLRQKCDATASTGF